MVFTNLRFPFSLLAISFLPFDRSGIFRTNESWITSSLKPPNIRKKKKRQESESKDLVPNEQNVMSKVMFYPTLDSV